MNSGTVDAPSVDPLPSNVASLPPSAWIRDQIQPVENVIVFTIRKGGPGKTSQTLGAADAFARFGLNVLVIDTDPQGNASFGLNAKVHQVAGGTDRFGKPLMIPDRFTVVDVVENGENGVVDDAVQIVDWGYEPDAPFTRGGPLVAGKVGVVGVVPCYSAIESLAKQWSLGDLTKLHNALQVPAEQGGVAPKERWDVVLIDTPPGGSDIGRLAVKAADKTLLLTTASPFGMDAIEQTLVYLDDIRNNYAHPNLETIGLVLSSYDPRLKQTKTEMSDFHEAQSKGHAVASVELWPERVCHRTVVPTSQGYRAPISALLSDTRVRDAATVMCQINESIALRMLEHIKHPDVGRLRDLWVAGWPGGLTPYVDGGPHESA